MGRTIKTLAIIAIVGFCSSSMASKNPDYEFCPGRGERCAYIKVLGIKFWYKKDKGGPGLIVKSEIANDH